MEENTLNFQQFRANHAACIASGSGSGTDAATGSETFGGVMPEDVPISEGVARAAGRAMPEEAAGCFRAKSGALQPQALQRQGQRAWPRTMASQLTPQRPAVQIVSIA